MAWKVLTSSPGRRGNPRVQKSCTFLPFLGRPAPSVESLTQDATLSWVCIYRIMVCMTPVKVPGSTASPAIRSRCSAALWYALGVGPLLPCSAKMSSSMVTAPPTSSPDCKPYRVDSYSSQTMSGQSGNQAMPCLTVSKVHPLSRAPDTLLYSEKICEQLPQRSHCSSILYCQQNSMRCQGRTS
jgi:hypothetical protein